MKGAENGCRLDCAVVLVGVSLLPTDRLQSSIPEVD